LNRNTPRSPSPSKWRFAVDRGGTFTDIVGLDPSGKFHSLKLLSNSPFYGNASIEGIKRMLGLPRDESLPETRIEGIRFGTTVATNALLERKGCRVALLITRGFSDALDIGYQSRPDIFSLCIKKSPPLYSTVVEIDERIDSRGKIVKECKTQTLAGDLKRLRNVQVDAVSVVLMHSWANPEHELLCERLLMEQGYTRIFLSHRTVNLIKSRGQSTVVDTYLSTVLAEYLEGIKKETGNIPVEFMQSNGTLSHPVSFLGKNALFSGPAGGAVAVAAIAEEKELKGIIGFDMGGTSTDVSRYDGTFAKRYEQKIGGIPLQLEMLDIITVAAGGGSILCFDGQKMTVGPDSAGSSPGPACYGFGGPLTITDANLITGKIVPEYFPNTFGPDRHSPVNSESARQKFLVLADEINRAMGTSLTPQGIAAGFLRIANEKMAMAIKEISVSRGLDIRRYGLVCFGGAGGQGCLISTGLSFIPSAVFCQPTA
jgi:5-oxoprolinase (ATP-hydrolysing)